MDETQAIRWQGDCLALLDQRLLPAQVSYLELFSAAEVARAIADLVVRGAPAIGITAAGRWGCQLGSMPATPVGAIEWLQIWIN